MPVSVTRPRQTRRNSPARSKPANRAPSLTSLVSQALRSERQALAMRARQSAAEALLPTWARREVPVIYLGGGNDRAAALSLWSDNLERAVKSGAEGDHTAAERVRSFFAGELARRKSAIKAERARVGIDALDRAAEDLEERVEDLHGRIETASLKSLADVAAVVRFMAAFTRDNDGQRVAERWHDAFARFAHEAESIASAQAS